ncbi:GRAM domain-containing protein [Psidium guajava]|nr:GRAM domain-containing protein [Psidium guajava]
MPSSPVPSIKRVSDTVGGALCWVLHLWRCWRQRRIHPALKSFSSSEDEIGNSRGDFFTSVVLVFLRFLLLSELDPRRLPQRRCSPPVNWAPKSGLRAVRSELDYDSGSDCPKTSSCFRTPSSLRKYRSSFVFCWLHNDRTNVVFRLNEKIVKNLAEK